MVMGENGDGDQPGAVHGPTCACCHSPAVASTPHATRTPALFLTVSTCRSNKVMSWPPWGSRPQDSWKVKDPPRLSRSPTRTLGTAL